MSEAPIEGATPAENTTPEASQPVAQSVRKIKVNGREENVNIDEVLKDYQKYRAADERFTQASQIRKSVDDLLTKVQNAESIEDLAELMPRDKFRKLAEKMFLEEIEYEQLPDHEKKSRSLEKRAQTAENRLKDLENKSQDQQRNIIRQHAHKAIDEEIAEAFKASGETPTPDSIIRVAELMMASMAKADQLRDPNFVPQPRIRAKDALSKVLEAEWGIASHRLSKAQIDEIRKRLPKEVLDGLRRSDVEAVKSQDVLLRKSNLPKSSDSSRKKPKAMKTDDWFAQMDKKFRR